MGARDVSKKVRDLKREVDKLEERVETLEKSVKKLVERVIVDEPIQEAAASVYNSVEPTQTGDIDSNTFEDASLDDNKVLLDSDAEIKFEDEPEINESPFEEPGELNCGGCDGSQ